MPLLAAQPPSMYRASADPRVLEDLSMSLSDPGLGLGRLKPHGCNNAVLTNCTGQLEFLGGRLEIYLRLAQ